MAKDRRWPPQRPSRHRKGSARVIARPVGAHFAHAAPKGTPAETIWGVEQSVSLSASGWPARNAPEDHPVGLACSCSDPCPLKVTMTLRTEAPWGFWVPPAGVYQTPLPPAIPHMGTNAHTGGHPAHR